MTILVPIDDTVGTESPESFAQEVRLAAAVKLFELGKVSSGKAAELAGISRVAFLDALTRFEVYPYEMTLEEFEQQVRNADPHRLQ